jgi:ATP:ADP antiporter, AAA family
LSDRAPPAESEGGILYRLLRKVTDIRPEEVPVVGWCWLYIFSILSSYYIMRPIRDQMGVAGGVNNLQWLFTATLVAMLLLNLPFAWLVARLPRSRFIPITYRFFAVNILVFAAVLYWSDPEAQVWIGRVFFVWVSVFNLFVISVFWQMNVDLFRPDQGKRLFGIIAAGATVGAIVGASVTASLARAVSPTVLMLGSAALLEVAVFAVGRLSRLSPTLHHVHRAAPSNNRDEAPTGGGMFGGIVHTFRSAYLINVALFLLLYSVTSTFLYMQQANIVSHGFADRGAQTAFFASIDLAVNVLTLVVQLLLTGRILATFGVALSLGMLPALTIIGFGALSVVPTVMVLAVFQVLRRAGDYAVARPSRELLFTVVTREDRYKAKSFIDTIVYRTGDQVGAWSTTFLRYLGLTSTGLALVAIPFGCLWLINALWLGRRQDVLADRQQMAADAAVGSASVARPVANPAGN